jgi:hypothetical protein
MEDAHTTLLNLNKDVPNAPADSFFAVFDGHGGILNHTVVNIRHLIISYRICGCQIFWRERLQTPEDRRVLSIE